MFDNSRKALADIIQILQKVLDVFSIVLFVVFTGFYGYQIYVHINDSIFILAIYCALIVIHTVTFIFSKTRKVDKNLTHAEKYEQKRQIRNRKRVFKIIKLSVNTAAIIWNFVDIITGTVSDLRIMIVLISAVLLFAQILMEIVLSLLLVYFDNLRIAVIEDIRGIDMDSNIVTKFVTKSLGIKKALKEVRDDDYFSETEKKIAEKNKKKK